MDGIWEFVFSQYFWGQVVIDDGDDFDGCDTFVNSNIIGFQFGRKYATAHARWNIEVRLGFVPSAYVTPMTSLSAVCSLAMGQNSTGLTARISQPPH